MVTRWAPGLLAALASALFQHVLLGPEPALVGFRRVGRPPALLRLVLLIRKYLTARGDSSPLIAALGDARLSRAVAAVVDAPAEAHTVASLAAVAGMSRSAFARLFGQSFAESPMKFVAKTRLHHAAELQSAAPMRPRHPSAKDDISPPLRLKLGFPQQE